MRHIAFMCVIWLSSRYRCVNAEQRIDFFDWRIRTTSRNQSLVEQAFPGICPVDALHAKPFNDPREIRSHKAWLNIQRNIQFLHALDQIFPHHHCMDQPVSFSCRDRMGFDRIKRFFHSKIPDHVDSNRFAMFACHFDETLQLIVAVNRHTARCRVVVIRFAEQSRFAAD